MEPYISSKKLIKYTFRLPKAFSSFFYFTLESNENLAFYSTLSHKTGDTHRDIVVRTTPELENQFKSLVDHCKKKGDIELLSREEEDDSPQ